MRRALTLFVICQPILAFGIERLYFGQHSPYLDGPRMDRELLLIKELGGEGIRRNFDIADLLMSDKSRVSNWGRKYVNWTFDKIKESGLKLHITLHPSVPGASASASRAANKFVIDEAVRRFSKDRLSFSLANEPRAFAYKIDDPVLTAHAKWAIPYIKDKGYDVYSPKLHGWLRDDNEPEISQAKETERSVARIQWLYASPFGSWLSQIGTATNFYVGWSDDPAEWARQKLDALLKVARKPFIIGEFGIRERSGVSRYDLGYQVGRIGAVLTANRDVVFSCQYVLAGVPWYSPITASGVRDEDWIRGFKVGIGLTQASQLQIRSWRWENWSPRRESNP
ncbi:MAG: hypothetical protein WAO58_08220 [Fimbriimonadaceae bacterium]